MKVKAAGRSTTISNRLALSAMFAALWTVGIVLFGFFVLHLGPMPYSAYPLVALNNIRVNHG